MNRQQWKRLHYLRRTKQAEKNFQRAIDAELTKASQRPLPEQSLSDDPQEVKRLGIDLLNSVDAFSRLRAALNAIAQAKETWSGIPMPLEGAPLTIEPKYPQADKLAEIGQPARDERDEKITIRNSWYSKRWNGIISIYQDGDGCIKHTITPHNAVGMTIATASCHDAWGVEQEHNAISLLGTLLPHRHYKSYLLTGMFCERSKRSDVLYIFRRLRPTLAMRTNEYDGRYLGALCMHPIGYYQGTFAGAMTPTDEVIAHLMLMRGDEHLYWRRCNQHSIDRPEAGV